MKQLLAMMCMLMFAACHNPAGNPDLASTPYPMNLHTATSVPIQVIRTDEYVEIVNSTANHYIDSRLWINQRYSMNLPPFRAGETLSINLWSLRDSFGEQFNAGGVWRTDEPTRLIIAELQVSDEADLVGLVVIGQD